MSPLLAFRLLNPSLHIRWRWFVALLLSIYLLRGIVLACVIPPLEMWDEYQHLAYIDCVVSTGQSPVYPVCRVDPQLLKQVVQLPACPSAWRQLSRFGVLTYAQYWKRSGTKIGLVVEQAPLLYEAQHPPVYYWLTSPIFRRFAGDLPLTISVLRIVNVAFIAIGLGAILIWLGCACRNQKHAALLGLCVALHPLFLLNADRVANDALAVMLGSLAIVWIMSLYSRFIPVQSLGIGFLIGLGAMTKATNLVLLPFAEFCLILLALRRRIEWGRCVVAIILLSAGMLSVTGRYFAWNLQQYGTITPMQEAVMNHAAHVKFADYFAYAPINLRELGIWRTLIWRWVVTDGLWVGGWSFLSPPRWMKTVYGVLLVTGVLAPVICRFFRPVFEARRSRGSIFDESTSDSNPFIDSLVGTRILVLCFLMLLALCYHAIQSMVAWKGACSTTPWYASVAVPWFLIGALSGLFIFRLRLIVCLAAVLFLTTELHGIFFQMVPGYACMQLSVDALHRLSTLRPIGLGMITLTLSLGLELSLVIAAITLIASLKDRPSKSS